MTLLGGKKKLSGFGILGLEEQCSGRRFYISPNRGRSQTGNFLTPDVATEDSPGCFPSPELNRNPIHNIR